MPRSWFKFAKEFGLTSTVRVVATHRGTGVSSDVVVPFPQLILGNYQNSPVWLTDPSVSKRHAYVQVLAGHVFVLDLHSRRGLQVGNAYVSQGWMPPGQTLQMGEFDLQFFPDPPPASPTPPDHWVGLPMGLARPDGLTPPSPLRGPITLIGRDPSAHHRVADIRLDPYHAAVVRTEATAWVVSLYGAGGVKLNGELVQAGRLKPGCRLDLNGVELLVKEIEATTGGGLAVPTATVGEPQGEVRELAILMGKMFATFQQEQTALLKRQNELLEVIADACRRGEAPVPRITTASPPIPVTPLVPTPQQLLPRESETLAEAHGWLMDRISALKPKPS